MVQEIRQSRAIRQVGVRRGRRMGGIDARLPRPKREDFLSALFGAFGGLRPQAPSTPLSFANEGDNSAARKVSSRTRARRLCRRLPGLLRARLRRTRLPDFGSRQSEPGGLLQRHFLPGQRHQGGLRQQHRQCRDREWKTLFRTAERVSLSQRVGRELTCNGKDQVGLAPVKIENDPTLPRVTLSRGAAG